MQRVRGGDHAAYGILVRRYSPIAVRTAAMLGAGSDAEDVVQEAFVKAYRALDRFRPGSEFRPWLLAIVANETRNLHRTSRRRTEREQRRPADLPTAEAADPADTAMQTERQAVVLAALERLAAPQREVLVCRYLLDLDERETAAVLGVSTGTVKSRAFRALRKLRTAVPVQEVHHDG